MIKRKGQLYELWSKDGSKKLFSSTSYQAVLERERQVEYFKSQAREKRKGNK